MVAQKVASRVGQFDCMLTVGTLSVLAVFFSRKTK
ncbi:MAG: hypothetical protein RLZZ298_2471 [Pseudomonadota bacterium]|jgi:hypothetical protein